MKKNGRPTIFNQELADKICGRIAEGESLRRICKDKEMPVMSTILLWIIDGNHKAFSEQYAQARSVQAEKLFEELLEIADESFEAIVGNDKSDNARVQAKKLMIDARKWYLSKVLPKKFGDKLDLTSDGKALPTPIYGGKSEI